MAGPADPLEQPGHLSGTVVLDHVIDVTHVDAQLHRGGTDKRRELAGLELRLDRDAGLAGQRSVVDADVGAVLFQPRAQCLGGLAGVDEHERRFVGGDELVDRADVTRDLGVGHQLPGQPLVVLCHRRPAHVDLEPSPDVDLDYLAGTVAGEQPRDLLGIADRRGEADPLDRSGQLSQPLERDRQLGPPLRDRELVDLVDDDVLDVFECAPELLPGKQRLQRLGGGDEHVRGVLGLRAPLVLGSVAVPDRDLYPEGLAPPLQPVAHVAVERPQRRHVQRPDPEGLVAGERVEDRQHRRLGLAAAGGRDHESVVPGRERPDRASLWLGRRVEPPLGESRTDRRAEGGKRIQALGLRHRTLVVVSPD